MDQVTNERIIRLKEVKNRTGLSCSTIYAWIKDGMFPKAVALGNKAIGWKESEISSWIETRNYKQQG